MHEKHHIDTDLDPEDIEDIADLDADEEVDVGPLLSPSDIRAADTLAPISPGTWLFDSGQGMELRACPKSLERVAQSRARTLRTDGETDE